MAEQDKKLVSKSVFSGKLPWIVAVVVFAGVGMFLLLGGISDRSSGGSHNSLELFAVRRDNLPISVTESGDIEALNSKDIKSEVEGRATIITIVDEGSYITEEDVNNGKVLVELDSSQIKEKLVRREIEYLSAEAKLSESTESLEIRKKQNESDIKGGQLKLKFALMDFQKYVGQVIAEEVYKQITDDANSVIDMAVLLEHPDLSGEALQKLRDVISDIDLNKQELVQAESTLEWTKKLYGKEYVSRSDLEADELKKNRREVSLEKAYTAKELFLKYEFPKELEKLLSDYEEAERELERIEARARSELAQAEAKLKSSEALFLVQKERLEKMQKQLAACVIKAPTPGQVVYASSMGSRWRRRNNPIEVGAEVNERERIISIPDMSVMKVEIKVHEVWIDKVQPGQKAEITIAAFPDRAFTGEVLKKAPLADRQRWFNPDLKAYATDVRIDGTHEYLKTGMSAKVTILIDELGDVLIVPIQTVINQEGKKVCYVAAGKGTERREVETGAFNNDFVEIKSGLTEGEKVLLNPPRISEQESSNG